MAFIDNPFLSWGEKIDTTALHHSAGLYAELHARHAASLMLLRAVHRAGRSGAQLRGSWHVPI
jgi:hypothetical protein